MTLNIGRVCLSLNLFSSVLHAYQHVTEKKSRYNNFKINLLQVIAKFEPDIVSLMKNMGYHFDMIFFLTECSTGVDLSAVLCFVIGG